MNYATVPGRGAARAEGVLSDELSPLAIDGLVELRWLHRSRRDDPVAVCEGFRRFIGFALDMSRNR